MNYVSLTVSVPSEEQDLLIAELIALGFESFLQENDHIQAFVAKNQYPAEAANVVLDWLAHHGYPQQVSLDEIEPRNWNAQWEASIRPIVAGSFVIAPTWSAVGGEYVGKTVIRIDPKMSFGTGHHQSTRLVLGFLPKFVRPNDRVLDAGTGTGVLGIAALKLGALHALVFDDDPWVEENVQENFLLNHVEYAYELRICGMEGIYEVGFDVIIANIQRNVLLEMMPDFQEKTKPNGFLILAGLLTETDRVPIIASAAAHGFTLEDEATEDEWWSGVFLRHNTFAENVSTNGKN
ncbi:MAG: 50S ribosomal protein L11 methyltransferase [Bacteroidetes Order II. Incertae sedis bacterium]|nr:50S ribosomal protein L11 methyltransferase [Bacteroidetes Order II. bacterium]